MAFNQTASLWSAVLLLLLITLSSAQCPNNLAAYNPDLRTSCMNGTYFIVPVDKATVEKAVSPYELLSLPIDDASLFPNGFPAGKHPVLVQSSFGSDIRMSVLQLPDELLSGGISVPYTDRLGDEKTPFTFSVKQYVGGANGQDISGVVPAIVGSLGGTTIHVGDFVPDDAAYSQISTSPSEFITQIKKGILPNPISGPGVILEAVDTDFFTASESRYTGRTFRNLISQPLILMNTKCQRNPIYFNETFADPVFRNGRVTLYSPGGAFAGVYNDVAGYSASGTQVGYNAESCESAAANTDPEALA